jgi:hypothetical protein
MTHCIFELIIQIEVDIVIEIFRVLIRPQHTVNLLSSKITDVIPVGLNTFGVTVIPGDHDSGTMLFVESIVHAGFVVLIQTASFRNR